MHDRLTQYMGLANAYLRIVYIDHPNAYIHILLTVILAFLLLGFVQRNNLARKLDGIDKRDLIGLLTIQKYCCSLSRAINELTETVNENDKTTKNKLRLVHTRMKDVYTGIFRHLNLNRIQRAPRTATPEQTQQSQKDCEERNEILHEIIQEMLATE